MSNSIKIDTCPLCLSREFEEMYTDFENNNYVRCVSCSLVFQNPRAIIDYEEDYWSHSKDPDGKIRNLMSPEERNFKVKNRMKKEIDYVNSLYGGKILDAGCGPGFFLAELNSKWEKYGVEISEYNIKYINDNFPNINTSQSKLEELPFSNYYFDIIYCFQVLEHVENPVKIIREFKRVLKPNGTIILSTPNIESFCSKRFKGNYRLLGTAHIVIWSPKTIKNLLNIIGYEIVKVRFPYFGTDYFTYKNVLRLFDKNKISPSFYGNEMTVYARPKYS
ncbi:MAG: methyltransferase domain-containing protein [Candidatus Marinimicrobia bacterium]|nr:methyltransferase domain-containing protein [Candidatus Neomarinimicrobiota bacterium]